MAKMQSLSARQNSYAGNTIARRAAVWMNDTGDAQHNGGDDMMSWLTKYKVSPSYFQPAYAGRGFIIQISIGNDLIHRQLCACIILIWTSGEKFDYVLLILILLGVKNFQNWGYIFS